MDVHDGVVTGGDDVLGLEDDELGFELVDGVHGLLRVGQDEADVDVRVLDAAEADADVVAAQSERHLLLHLVVDGGDLDRRLVRHEEEVLVLADLARLNLADNDASHVAVLFRDGHHERRVVLAVHQRHLVEEREERGALDPGSDLAVDRLLDVGAGEARDGNKGDVGLHVVARTLEEGRELGDNLVVPARGKGQRRSRAKIGARTSPCPS